MSGKKTGAVLVVGGGIGGVQASLDLAESGFKVYLVEKQLSIGGVMAQLDKTFPTNDCSMCILSPKLVECGRHENIELLTYSEVVSIEGEPGNFRVKLLCHPRYVDIDKCKGCGDCADACPVERPNWYEENLAMRKAIYRPLDQATPSAFGVDKLGIPPCRAACPIHVNAEGYIALTAAGKFEEALELVREKNPFPGITGRICTHPCEEKCDRAKVDEPVAIDYIKRFLADWELKNKGERDWNIEKEEPTGKSVGIVGAGPAGLLAAYDLAKKGHSVTIYEALPKPGGMMWVGIPAYRLPRDVLFGEIELLEKLGVKFVFDTQVGKDITTPELRKKHNALFLAIGAHKSRKLKIPGEELEGVFGAVEFLRKVNIGEEVFVGKKSVVIGGGNAAVDAARVLWRLGSDVSILYRRTIKEMPANPEEIEETMEEGIPIEFLATPVKIIGKGGKVVGIECVRMRLGEPDESGRRRPIPIEGSNFTMDVDMVVPAISQSPDISALGELGNIKLTRWNTFEVDPITLQTSVEGVFAGGDAVSGPATFIQALESGRRGAISIDRYLKGEELHTNREGEGPFETDVEATIEGVLPSPRMKMPAIDVKKRRGNFSEVYSGFDEEMAVSEAKRCLTCAICCECFQCVKACEPDAIIHNMLPTERELQVGSVILAPGFDEFDPSLRKEYGYDRFQNVITSIEFERILSASGPFKGHILRLSDHKHPTKLAWIQCVGSRDKQVDRPYCSSVCCMYATKEAVIAVEHAPDVHATIFYMDMRAFGKDFDKYIERAEKEYKVRFVRSRVANIDEDPKTKNLYIRYEDEAGRLKVEEFEMVILSVGLDASHSAEDFCNIFGIELNDWNFAKTSLFEPLKTTQQGVFVGGAFSGPKDVPETVAQCSGVAAEASSLLSDARGTEIVERELPPERDVRGEHPRIGVFVCRCGINIGGVVDVPEVTEYAGSLPDVVFAMENIYTCSQDTQEIIKEKIEEYNLNRVVVASCTPRTHEALFQQTIREAGLNPYLFTMANIRDQDSWVHKDAPKEATEKAKDLVRMAVSKARHLEPLYPSKIEVTRKALVIGAGVTGMNSALKMADEGYFTYLVEKENELGGHIRHIHYTLDGDDPQKYLSNLEKRLESNEKVKIYKGVHIEDIEGFVGNFKTTIKTKDGDIETLEHGVVIVATGADENHPALFGYGEADNVMLQSELEEKIARDDIASVSSVVMIQCVDSRNESHPYCSRFCCREAVKNALKLKEKKPDINIIVLYRDMRTYGFSEVQYEEARKRGVLFIRYTPEKEPEVDVKSRIATVRFHDPLLSEEFEITPDILALSVGVVPDREENDRLAKMLKVPLTEDGFFLEAHMKLRPVDFATDGVFLAGLAHAPKCIDESISQAYAAVSRACMVLSKDFIETPGTVAKVNELTCVGCGMCVDVCPYSAISLVEKKVLGKLSSVAEVNPALCKGCGVCAASCRSGSIDLAGFSNREIMEEMVALVWR